jgi:hypothetical protein
MRPFRNFRFGFFCHSEGIFTSRFCCVFCLALSFRRNLYVSFLSRFVALCHSEGIFTSRFCLVFVACFVIQKESSRRVFFYSLILRTGAEHLNICRKINKHYFQGAEHRNLLRTIFRCSAPYETLFGSFYKY